MITKNIINIHIFSIQCFEYEYFDSHNVTNLKLVKNNIILTNIKIVLDKLY